MGAAALGSGWICGNRREEERALPPRHRRLRFSRAVHGGDGEPRAGRESSAARGVRRVRKSTAVCDDNPAAQNHASTRADTLTRPRGGSRHANRARARAIREMSLREREGIETPPHPPRAGPLPPAPSPKTDWGRGRPQRGESFGFKRDASCPPGRSPPRPLARSAGRGDLQLHLRPRRWFRREQMSRPGVREGGLPAVPAPGFNPGGRRPLRNRHFARMLPPQSRSDFVLLLP